MKRPVAILIALAFLAMLGLDSNACYFIMLTCDPAVACVIASEPEAPSCQFSCGAGQTMACEPVVTDDTRVCVTPLTSGDGFNDCCDCDMAPPPFASTAAERKQLETNTGHKLTISFVPAPQSLTCGVMPRESNLLSVHPAIPITVLRC